MSNQQYDPNNQNPLAWPNTVRPGDPVPPDSVVGNSPLPAAAPAGITEVTKAWVRWVDEYPEAAAVVDHVILDGDFSTDHRGHIQIYVIDDLGQSAFDLVTESLGMPTNDGFVPPKYDGTDYRQWCAYGELFSVHAVAGRSVEVKS